MKTALFLFIKNEQKYLKEWLDYHIALGFTDIYICEDYESTSHADICSLYDNVHIENYRCEIPNCPNVGTICSSCATCPWRQEILTDGMRINHKKEYDWYLALDSDEFLVLKDETLEEFLSKRSGCISIILYWNICGANGYITPDPNKTQLEMYGDDERGYFPSLGSGWKGFTNNKLIGKRAYGLHSPDIGVTTTGKQVLCYDNETGIDPNTSMFNNVSFEHAYIKHLFTRSWEEWVEKCKRGCVVPDLRKLTTFFEINTELENQKEELIKNYVDSDFINIKVQ